jgi:hypothetical protein
MYYKYECGRNKYYCEWYCLCDCGYSKLKVYNPRIGMDILQQDQYKFK